MYRLSSLGVFATQVMVERISVITADRRTHAEQARAREGGTVGGEKQLTSWGGWVSLLMFDYVLIDMFCL